MAKTPFKLSSNVFIDEYEKEIELSTKRNIERLVDEKAIKKSHNKIVDILKSENQNDNIYLSYETYFNLVQKFKDDKARKIKEKEEKLQQEEHSN
jgi:hypothetical protein